MRADPGGESEAAESAPMAHVCGLAGEIGPRPSTGPGERRAAEFIAAAMRATGGEPNVESFLSPKSGWRPFALASAMALAAEALFLLWPRPAGAALASAIVASALACAILELLFIPNPLAWALPKAPSQNVWMRIAPRGVARGRVLVVAHYDTHRTPLAYSSPAWVRIFRSLTSLGMGASALLAAIFAAGILFPGASGLRAASLLVSVIHLLLFALTAQADLAPHTPGANDNASGVGALLALADRFRASPMESSDLWFLATGCEEVGLYGMRAFVRAHEADLRDRKAPFSVVNIDSIGGRGCGPCFISSEKLLATFPSDPGLLALAAETMRDRPDLEARQAAYQGAYTDGAIAIKAGLPTITFLGLDKRGWIPHVHQMSDVVANVDPEALARTTDFIEALIRKIGSRWRACPPRRAVG